MKLIVVFPFVVSISVGKKKEKYIHNLKCIGRKLNEKLRTINLDKNIYVSNETLSEARKHFSEDKVNLGIVW